MRESDKDVEEIISDILSRDASRIWSGSCAVCSLSQNHEKIVMLLPYRQKFEDATRGIALGGGLAPNSRYLNKAFEIMDFHNENKNCPCCLLGEFFNPIHCVEDGYFNLINTVYMSDGRYIDYYILRCNQCGTTYKVEEREYHYTWWNWIAIT